MTQPKGAQAPFSLSRCVPRLRDDALLNDAVEAFRAGMHADALLSAEQVCRRLPSSALAAMLRASIVQSCAPDLASRAWFAAWSCDPENPMLQDALLRAWLAARNLRSVAELGPAFLPARCQEGSEASLVALLHQAGLAHAGACWKADGTIEAVVFGGTGRARVRVDDGVSSTEYDVPADATRFRLPCPHPERAVSISYLLADMAAPALMQGSPLVFAAAPLACPDPARAAGAPAAVSVVIPVYRGLALVQACIGSVLASLRHNRRPARIVVIDDASPEPALSAWLDQLAGQGSIELLRNSYNLGFIETVNRGLRLHTGDDVLLLNADTMVHGDWIDRLDQALYASADVASVTPWSNNGEISSFPRIGHAAPAPTPAQLAAVDAAAAQLRRDGVTTDVELPSCCGFAMLIKRQALDAVGLLDGVALVRGYGEEVDWCRRARAAGYRHLAATGVFVAHTGNVSFSLEKTLRVRQNRNVLAARYPDYFPAYEAFFRDDPLADARAALLAALAQADAAWIAAPQGETAAPGTPLAALPASCRRIGVCLSGPSSAAAHAKVLALARQVASRPAQLPALRLLVVGAVAEPLWRTGVVDAMPSATGQEAALLSDADIMALAGCSVLLGCAGVPATAALPYVIIDHGFDPAAWLSAWTAAADAAPPYE